MNTISHKKSLKNDGKLELFFIGTGSAFAQKHNQTNFLIIKGEDHVAVDFGMSGPKALLETAGLSPTDLRIVLPTHSHSDHVGGIECLALTNRYVGMRFMGHPKLKIIINEEYQRLLWTHTLQGGLEQNESQSGGAECLGFSDFFDVIRPSWKTHQPRETWTVNIGDIKIDLFRTKHIPEQANCWDASFVSYGLCIDDRVFYSGDTRFDADLIDIYKDCEIMFHDDQFFPGAVHTPLADLKTLPDDIKKKMFLIHYADNYDLQDINGFGGWTKQGVSYIFD